MRPNSQPDARLANKARKTLCRWSTSQMQHPLAGYPHQSTVAMATGCNPFDQQFVFSSSPSGAHTGRPCSPDLHCNLSRSLLQLTFPSKYQLWPLAGLELKGSSANLTGPVHCHLAGREGGKVAETLFVYPRAQQLTCQVDTILF